MSWDLEYPRPQLKRENYMILSEGWTLNGLPIQVPFPPESLASHYGEKVREYLCYETSFMFYKEQPKVMLHFGAVDQFALVYVNGVLLGKHEGGYVPFDVDISKVVKNGKNSLRVDVRDSLDHTYPYGKQRRFPSGMWYTQVSGIWQTVWLEQISADGIFDLVMDTTTRLLRCVMLTMAQTIKYTIYSSEGNEFYEKTIRALRDSNRKIIGIEVDFEKEKIPIHLWSPEHPYLYTMTIETDEDKVETYFALREFTMGKGGGKQRLYLNGEPLFLHGVLDQGYFIDGIYLPEEPEEYDNDVLRMKELGFNTLRKHLKVEPERFYYACDKYGMIVLQDMVNNGGYSFIFDTLLPTLGMWHRPDRWPWGEERKKIFEKHSLSIVSKTHNHPCVIGYTIFNEGWGQFEADRMYKVLKKAEPNRFIDSTSGWFVQKKSDFESFHIYFRNERLASKVRPLLLSEAGGFARPIAGHLYKPEKHYGYGREAENENDLMQMLEAMYHEMVIPSIADGMCGCIYTQLSDVETEINGLYTYDRCVCKVDVQKMKAIAEQIKKARLDAEQL